MDTKDQTEPTPHQDTANFPDDRERFVYLCSIPKPTLTEYKELSDIINRGDRANPKRHANPFVGHCDSLARLFNQRPQTTILSEVLLNSTAKRWCVVTTVADEKTTGPDEHLVMAEIRISLRFICKKTAAARRAAFWYKLQEAIVKRLSKRHRMLGRPKWTDDEVARAVSQLSLHASDGLVPQDFQGPFGNDLRLAGYKVGDTIKDTNLGKIIDRTPRAISKARQRAREAGMK